MFPQRGNTTRPFTIWSRNDRNCDLIYVVMYIDVKMMNSTSERTLSWLSGAHMEKNVKMKLHNAREEKNSTPESESAARKCFPFSFSIL